MTESDSAQPNQILGGPPAYSQACDDESGVLRMHAGNGDMSDLGRRFVARFLQALRHAALGLGRPADLAAMAPRKLLSGR